MKFVLQCCEALLGDNARLLGVKSDVEPRSLPVPVVGSCSPLVHNLCEDSYVTLHVDRGVSRSALSKFASGLTFN